MHHQNSDSYAGQSLDVFDETATHYDESINRGISMAGEPKEFYASQRLAWIAQKLASMGVHPRTVLDFGCGTGGSTPYFFSSFPSVERVIGLDRSQLSLEIARRNARVAGLKAEFFSNAEEILASIGPLDLAFCNGVFHHIAPAERLEALATVRSLLAPKSNFIFSENNPLNPVTRFAMKRIPFDKDAILIRPGAARRLLRRAGFTVDHTDFLFFFPHFLRWLRPMEKGLRWMPVGAQYMVFTRRLA